MLASEKYARRHFQWNSARKIVMSIRSTKLSGVARKSVRSLSWAAFGTASVFLFAANVQAETPKATQVGYLQYSTTVSYGDLDLSRDADAKVLYSRLRAAAKSVCGTVDARNLRMRQAAAECFQQSLATAVSDVGNAKVAAAHASDPSIRVASRAVPATGRT
jgi:UrcA family protein